VTPEPTPEDTPTPRPVPPGAIAFYSDRDGNAEIYVMNPDGSGQTRLTHDDADDTCPTWSPDGTKLAFVAARHDPDALHCFPDCHYELYVMNVDGSQQTRLTDTPGTELHPAWSPDGTQIAFVSDRDGNQEIYVVDADGSNPRRLTDDPADDMCPTWSPDGRQIAFNSQRDGNWQIYVMNADGGDVARLTDTPDWSLFPDWSPDGARIVFFRMQSGVSKQDIYVMDADGGNVQRLTDNPRSVDEDPVWSPDGTHIAFQSDRDGHFQIYVMEADGSNQQPLTTESSDQYWPAWSRTSLDVALAQIDAQAPTDTPSPPTATPAPTPTPIPPKPTAQPATHTICADGCDFATIQGALDDVQTPAGAVLEVTDPVHTEPGIVVNKDITIRGLGLAATIVQAHEEPGQASERVFYVPEGSSVILEGMTIRHGRPLPKEEVGGGILNHGTLTLMDCLVTENTAIGGGGISSEGTMTVWDSTISHNVARGDGPRGEECGGGGGLKSSKGTLTIVNSTISDNRAGLGAEGLGGGIRTGCGCTAEIINSTISGNRAARYGGGIAGSGSVHITHCTISHNIVRSAGGALWIRGKVGIENTIIGNNASAGGDCTIGGQGGHVGTGSLTMSRHNLIQDGSCEAELSGDPLLGPLADNGGLTRTHALGADSPAIDAIPAADCHFAVDQRGAARPIVLTSDDTPYDIGAFELQAE
jgi:Tol biopolymer transport system component